MVKVKELFLKERNCSLKLFPLREGPILKRDVTEENQCCSNSLPLIGVAVLAPLRIEGLFKWYWSHDQDGSHAHNK